MLWSRYRKYLCFYEDNCLFFLFGIDCTGTSCKIYRFNCNLEMVNIVLGSEEDKSCGTVRSLTCPRTLVLASPQVKVNYALNYLSHRIYITNIGTIF